MKALKNIQSKNYAGEVMTLIVESTGIPVFVGAIIDGAIILRGTAPHKPSSTGRVEVMIDGFMTEYFPGTMGLKWVGGAQ